MIQQEDVHNYLLTLSPKHRELVRKDLMILFKLALKKRLLHTFHEQKQNRRNYRQLKNHSFSMSRRQ
jgi:hypothetical protein